MIAVIDLKNKHCRLKKRTDETKNENATKMDYPTNYSKGEREFDSTGWEGRKCYSRLQGKRKKRSQISKETNSPRCQKKAGKTNNKTKHARNFGRKRKHYPRRVQDNSPNWGQKE